METAKLFWNGRSQAVRLSKDFRFEGDEVFIKRMGNAVVLLLYDGSWGSRELGERLRSSVVSRWPLFAPGDPEAGAPAYAPA